MDLAAVWMVAAVLLQGALALGLMWFLGFVRVPLIARREVRIKEIAISKSGWPEWAQQVSNAVDNQFQLPVLFFVAAIVSLNFGPTLFETILALAFVASRFVHAFIHITDNHVVRRFWVFTFGLALLTLFWLSLCFRLFVAALEFGS